MVTGYSYFLRYYVGFKFCGVIKELSINLYSGTPGSGKSLHSADIIQGRLNFGWDVIGTMTINESLLRKNHKGVYYYQNIYDLTPKKLVDFSKEYFKVKKFRSKTIENKLLLVIDECQRIFNSRDWQKNTDRMEWITFFAEHRHLGYEIILISQNDLMLDKQIRGLIEYEYIHRKVGNAGFGGKIFNILSFSELFVSVKMWYPLKSRDSSEFFRGSKRLYNFYDSYEQFDISAHSDNLLPVWLQESEAEPDPVPEFSPADPQDLLPPGLEYLTLSL